MSCMSCDVIACQAARSDVSYSSHFFFSSCTFAAKFPRSRSGGRYLEGPKVENMTVTNLTQKEMNELKSEVLQERMDYLCNQLGDPRRYFPALRSKGVLTYDDCERVKSKVTSTEKVRECGPRRNWSSCTMYALVRKNGTLRLVDEPLRHTPHTNCSPSHCIRLTCLSRS